LADVRQQTSVATAALEGEAAPIDDQTWPPMTQMAADFENHLRYKRWKLLLQAKIFGQEFAEEAECCR
jgi:hypothetical protein